MLNFEHHWNQTLPRANLIGSFRHWSVKIAKIAIVSQTDFFRGKMIFGMFKTYIINMCKLILSVMGYLTMIFSWIPQPNTGFNLVWSLWQSYHATRSLAWPITQKMKSLALKMKKIRAFHFLKKSLIVQKSVKFYKGKVGRGNF